LLRENVEKARLLDASELESLIAAIRACGQLPRSDDLDASQFWRRSGTIRSLFEENWNWVLIDQIGRAVIVDGKEISSTLLKRLAPLSLPMESHKDIMNKNRFEEIRDNLEVNAQANAARPIKVFDCNAGPDLNRYSLYFICADCHDGYVLKDYMQHEVDVAAAAGDMTKLAENATDEKRKGFTIFR